MGAISKINEAGLRLRLDGDELLAYPPERITDELRDLIRANRTDILEAAGAGAGDRFARACKGLTISPEELRAELEEGGDLPDVESGALSPQALRQTAITLDLMRGAGVGPPRHASIAEDWPEIHASVMQAQGFTCGGCRHFLPVEGHTHLGRCGAGRDAPGGDGLWFDTDRHECEQWGEKKECGRPLPDNVIPLDQAAAKSNAFYRHLMDRNKTGCGCFAQAGRYCAEGKRLRGEYYRAMGALRDIQMDIEPVAWTLSGGCRGERRPGRRVQRVLQRFRDRRRAHRGVDPVRGRVRRPQAGSGLGRAAARVRGAHEAVRDAVASSAARRRVRCVGR
jgi:hypothetical protein